MSRSSSPLGERGGAAVLAVSLPLLVLVAGLVIDLGRLFVLRARLQQAADLGALAGARAVDRRALARGSFRLAPEAAGVASAVARENLAALLGPRGLRRARIRAAVESEARNGPSLLVWIEMPAELLFLPSGILGSPAIRVLGRAGAVRRRR